MKKGSWRDAQREVFSEDVPRQKRRLVPPAPTVWCDRCGKVKPEAGSAMVVSGVASEPAKLVCAGCKALAVSEGYSVVIK